MRPAETISALLTSSVLFVASAIHAFIDVHLFGSDAAGAVAVVYAATLLFAATCLGGSALSARAPEAALSNWTRRNSYWIVTASVGVYLVACDVVGILGAYYAGLRIVTGQQYLRMTGCVILAVSWLGLRPPKAWALALGCYVPLLAQPLALLVPGSWEARHATDFAVHFAVEVSP